MATERGRTLTPREVAEIWFGTRSPSADQMRKVYAKMKSGVLPLNNPEAPPAHWTTNEQALARYLASRRTTKESAQHEKGKRIGPAAGPPTPPTLFVHRSDKDLRDAYATVWQSYFLAVIGRRQNRYATRNFQRAVIAGQVTAVLVIALLVAQACVTWWYPHPLEQRLIEAHLSTHYRWHHVERWYTPEIDDQGHRVVRVEYRYRDGDSHQTISTDRVFIVTDDEVTEQSIDDG